MNKFYTVKSYTIKLYILYYDFYTIWLKIYIFVIEE